MIRRQQPVDWMWAEACELLAQADRMHRQFFHLASHAGAETVWEPPVDVFEDDREVAVVVALPGVAPERVEISVETGFLVVRAERPQPFTASRRTVRQLEIPYGYFERRIALPAGPLEAFAQELAQGCLVLRLRKVN